MEEETYTPPQGITGKNPAERIQINQDRLEKTNYPKRLRDQLDSTEKGAQRLSAWQKLSSLIKKYKQS